MADSGTMFVEKSDIEKLIETLNGFFAGRDSDENPNGASNKVKGVLPKKPTYDSLNRNIGNLGLAVPIGFWMLHNDLLDINEQLNGGGAGTKSKLSWTDIANNLVDKLPAMTGIIAGAIIVNNLLKDSNPDKLTNLLSVIPKFVGELITDVGGALISLIRNGGIAIADVYDYFTDPEMKAKRRALSARYLSLSYAQLYEGMGYDVIIDETTGEITGFSEKAVRGGEIAGAVSKGVSLVGDVLSGADGVFGIIGKGLKKNAVSKVANLDTWVNGISDLIQENARGLVATGLDVYDMFTDPEVQEQRRKLLGNYMQAMYAELISAMGYAVDFKEDGTLSLKEKSKGMQTLDTAKGLLKEGYTAIKTGGATVLIEGLSNTLSTAATKLGGAISSVMDLVGDNPIVRDMSAKYAGLYMQAYYANLIGNMGFDIDFENDKLKEKSNYDISLGSIFQSIGSALGELFSSGGSAATKGAAVLNSIDTLRSDDTRIVSVSYKYAPLYMEAYWISLIEAMGFEVNKDGENVTVKTVITERETRKGLFKSISEWFTGDDTSKINSALTSGIKSQVTNIFNDIVATTSWNYLGAYVGAFFEAYFNNLVKDIDTNPGTWGLTDKKAEGKKEFEKAVLTAMANSFSSEGITAAVEINSKDYTEVLRTMSMSLNTMKSYITEIHDSIGFDIQTDIKTIADNSGKTPVVEFSEVTNGVSSSFSYETAQPR